VTRRFSLLAVHPYLGRARDDEFGADSRSFPVGEYVIVYCIEGEDVAGGAAFDLSIDTNSDGCPTLGFFKGGKRCCRYHIATLGSESKNI
jgi:hypothetical protein